LKIPSILVNILLEFYHYYLVKQQEQIRHEVNMPGSDVEDYIGSLDQLLTQKQNEIIQLKDMISQFYSHIKQEKDLSQKFYLRKEDEEADLVPEIEEY